MVLDFVDPILNWPTRFRVNPVFTLLNGEFASGDYLQVPPSYILFCKIWFLISFLGILLFLKPPKLVALCLGLLVSTVLITVSDGLFWPLVHVLPTSLLLILLAEVSAFRKQLAFVLVSSCLWGFLGGPIALLGLFALLAVGRNLSAAALSALVTICIAASLMFLPVYQMPDYPPGARLALINPKQFWGQPLSGPDIHPDPLNYKNFSELSDYFSKIALLSLLLGWLLLIIFWLKKRIEKAELIFTLLSLCPLLIVTLDHYNNHRLLALSAAIIPGLSLVPHPVLLLHLFIVGLAVLTAKEAFKFPIGAKLLLGIFTFFFFVSQTFQYKEGLRGNLLKKRGEQFTKVVEAHFPQSFWGVQTGASVPHKLQSVSSNYESAGAALAVDHKKNTRWTSEKPQKGDEWFELRFAESTSCPILEIDLGPNTADFPRGIAVELLMASEGIQSDSAKFQRKFEIGDWSGSLKYTERGRAYFGNQSEIRLPMGQDKLRAIRLLQLGTDTFHFWSIAEINCYDQLR